jgi:predicted DNA-binding protein (MmcQ/YjbR family)
MSNFNIEFLRDYCLSKPFSSEGFPFDSSTIVFKVGGKMFAIADVEDFNGINLKCNPDFAIELREKFNGIVPGYHSNKKHWNTVYTDQDVPFDLIVSLIDHSYDLVLASLPKKIKSELK